MLQLPLNLQEIGALARRDLERACVRFLEACAGNLTEVLEALRTTMPPDWGPDLLPLFSWLHQAAESEGAGWLPDRLVARLFQPDRIVASPLMLVRKALEPGEEISEELARRLGSALQILEGEGERLVLLERVVLLTGSHLAYLRVVDPPVRARRISPAEREAMLSVARKLEALEERLPAEKTRGFRLRYRRLLSAPNQDYPATLRRIEALPTRQRILLWRSLVAFQCRLELPEDRRPPISHLLARLARQKIELEPVHIARLLGLAGSMFRRLQPDPQVARGLVQTTRAELEEYLGGMVAGPILPRYNSDEGVQRLNVALIALSDGEREADWPEGLEAELTAFRDQFLKRLHARPIELLLAVDPVELIRRGLERNAGRSWPEFGELERLLEAWRRLDAELQALLEPGMARKQEASSRAGERAAGGSGEEVDGPTVMQPASDAASGLGGVDSGQAAETGDEDLESVTVRIQLPDLFLDIEGIGKPGRTREVAKAGGAASGLESAEASPPEPVGSTLPERVGTAETEHVGAKPAESVASTLPEGVASTSTGGVASTGAPESSSTMWISVGAPEAFPIPDLAVTREAVKTYVEDAQDGEDDSISSRIGLTGSFPLPMPEDDSISIPIEALGGVLTGSAATGESASPSGESTRPSAPEVLRSSMVEVSAELANMMLELSKVVRELETPEKKADNRRKREVGAPAGWPPGRWPESDDGSRAEESVSLVALTEAELTSSRLGPPHDSGALPAEPDEWETPRES